MDHRPAHPCRCQAEAATNNSTTTERRGGPAAPSGRDGTQVRPQRTTGTVRGAPGRRRPRLLPPDRSDSRVSAHCAAAGCGRAPTHARASQEYYNVPRAVALRHSTVNSDMMSEPEVSDGRSELQEAWKVGTKKKNVSLKLRAEISIYL